MGGGRLGRGGGAGAHTLEFDAARLGSDAHFCRLASNGEAQARKLTVVE